MPSSFYIDKSRMDYYLCELAKEYRKLSKIPLQIIIVGGAAILSQYDFRTSSVDIDGFIYPFSDAMKSAINKAADRLSLPNGWLNDDFKYTSSFTNNILFLSKYYRTFSRIVEVRVVEGVYLIAMKLVALRNYKNDLSDILGILIEERNEGNMISIIDIKKAITDLYGVDEHILSQQALSFLEQIYSVTELWKDIYLNIKKKESDNRLIVREKQLIVNGAKDIDEVLKIIEKTNKNK